MPAIVSYYRASSLSLSYTYFCYRTHGIINGALWLRIQMWYRVGSRRVDNFRLISPPFLSPNYCQTKIMKLLRNRSRKQSKWEMMTVAGPCLHHVTPVSGLQAFSNCICLRIFQVGIKPAACAGHPLCLSSRPALRKCSERAVSHPGPACVPGGSLERVPKTRGERSSLFTSARWIVHLQVKETL